ncbi:MAG: hypothetical protein JO093_17130 [Acidobacteria bacterium]|nr:hypothetical protein [Acidobacteriota bacterium]MBV9068822.1 hypothetical protein [Acidobacteriota bacterium]MBV9187342.1 hypothetical protein [Acidobacteriota bacterium]
MRTTFAILVILFAASLAAQPLTVGTQIVDAGGTATITSSGPVTYVNLFAGATKAGTVNKATVGWSAACSNGFKIVFLRQNFNSVAAFTVVASRGPFNAVKGRNEVTLSPPVSVSQGDLIGVVQLQSLAACGSVLTQSFADPRTGYNLITTADMSTTGGTISGGSSNYSPGYAIEAIAYDTNPVLVRVLPAAGAAPGATAFFRTSLQMLNATTNTIAGNLVFHKQLQPGSSSDPSLPFSLAPGQSISYPDVVTSMGTTGIGSLDILTNGGDAPIATARVFSDGGTAGTSGFSEESLSPDAALDFFSRGILLIPSDLTNFRMNIGVRTLDTGATLDVFTYDSGGTLRATRTLPAYGANVFDQMPVATFTGMSSPPPGGYILIAFNVFGGRAFVYSSVIDNKTSDSTFRLADIK